VEEILRYIEQHWSFMSSSDCIPIKVALQLMDPSSLGLQDQTVQFAEAHTQLQNALKVIVNEHHQGFNSSIGTFHKIQTAIRESQHRVRQLRAGLVSAQKNLSTNRPELKALAQSSQNYDAMLQTISTIETIQLVPDQLEAQIREKRYLGAVDNLLEALGMIRKPELEDIGALSELRVHLSNQEQILTDLLVEELHNHLYLKSPYCEERWKAKISRERSSDDTSATIGTNKNLDAEDMAMYRFLDSYDGKTAMQEDATRNPEADTFYYIQLLIESLNKMSRLDVAADRIEERLPVELFKVLERTLGEVETRHPQALLGSGARSRGQQGLLTLGDKGVGGIDAEQKLTLEDLLATLYAKFEAIAEGHRVLYDVTAAILRRDSVPASDGGPLNRSFRELWKLLQSEIRNLLHDHLATDGNLGMKARQQNNASANIFRPQPRDRNRKLFKLSDALREKRDPTSATSKTSNAGNITDLVSEREDLQFLLKSSVPGLVNSNMLANQKDGLDHDTSEGADRSATGHKLLVSPSIFNMGILLPPSLHFLHHLREIVPPHSSVAPSTLTAFLDDFLINVFYPQLDETLLDLCGRCMGDLDTFQPDPRWTSFASKPVFKGIKRFLDVMEGVCSLLVVLPHEQSFAQLVVGQMRGVYDRCYEWSKGLLQRVHMNNLQNGQDPGSAGNEAVKMRLAADLATDGDVNEIVIELLRLAKEGGENESEAITKEKMVCAEKESELLIRLIKSKELEDADLLIDRKALAALCTLHVSMKWLAARCASLRFVSPRAVDTANTQVGQEGTRKRWTAELTRTTTGGVTLPQGPYLPCDQQTATQLDAVLMSFTELSTLILRTLHIDLRLQLLQGVYKAMDTTYALNQPYNDPDPAILTLSSSLSTYDAVLSTHLLEPQYKFLTSNPHILINNALTSLATTVPAMDAHGNARMSLNILVLQQSLKSLQPDADLNKAARFYELGALGPDAVVKVGPKEGYAVGDLKALVRLCYVEPRDKELGSVDAVASKLGGFPERKASLKGRSRSRAGRGGREGKSPAAG
jgi:exocyst complex component 4